MTTYPAIRLKVGNDYQFIFPSEIIHIQSDGSYSILSILNKKKVIVSKKLKEIEAILPNDIFVRVHHSCVINLMYVSRYSNNSNSNITLRNGDFIKLSRRKKAEFLDRFIMV